MVRNEYKRIDAGNIYARVRPGRHPCNCQARVHALIRNCLGCGRIVCEQEGSGPCFYCGRLVCTREERKIIEKKNNESLGLLRKLLNDPKIESVDLVVLNSSTPGSISLASLGKSVETANAYKQKLLKADKDQEITKVNDLQADYFSLEHNPYLTTAEREAIVKRKEELRQISLQTKKNILVDVDVGSGSVKEQKQKSVETVHDPIIQSILVSSAARNLHIKNSPSTMKPLLESEESDLIDVFQPRYEEGQSQAELQIGDRNENGTKIKPIWKKRQQKLHCIALKQPFAGNLLNQNLSEDKIIGFIPWKRYEEHRGTIVIASLSDDFPTEYFNETLENAKSLDESQYPRTSLLGKAQLFDCITWDEFNHEFSSLPSYRPLQNFFVLLLSDIEALSSPLPYAINSEFFEMDKSALEMLNLTLVNGGGILDVTDAVY